MNITDVLARIVEYQVRHVCVTGGEPLAQPACLGLLTALCDAGYLVSLETSGALDIAAVDRRVAVVLDLKTPASGECARNRWSNLPHLKRDDQVKFVICNRADYDWAREQLRHHDLSSVCEVLFSPAWNEQPARELADWILADRLPVRMQVQLHKFLWGDVPGH
jgi:7-carboxy-7-deazaguanine synthase